MPPKPAATRPFQKLMSSRLLTMKFMQRNASSKVREEAQQAIAAENAKREAAFLATREASNSAANEDVETRWELSFVKSVQNPGIEVVEVGYGQLAAHRDGEGEEEGEGRVGGGEEEEEEEGGGKKEREEGTKEKWENSGRMVFGKFKGKNTFGDDDLEAKGASDDSGSDSSQDDSPRKLRKQQFRNKDVSLKGLKSISGNFVESKRTCKNCKMEGHVQANCPTVLCYSCRTHGHLSSDCPQKKKRRAPNSPSDQRERKRYHYR